MEKLVINGGKPLKGEVTICGAKNAAIAILPAVLLKCTSLTRPGLSAYKMASEIIQNNASLGIPTGPNPDGSENLINAFIYNMMKVTVDGLHNDAFVQACIPGQSIAVQTTGANSGGLLVGTGFNLTDTISTGLIS